MVTLGSGQVCDLSRDAYPTSTKFDVRELQFVGTYDNYNAVSILAE